MATVILTCQECRCLFSVPPCREKAKWCSWKCRTARPRSNRQSRAAYIRCEICGAAVKRVRKDRNQRFCSLACRDQVAGLERRKRVGCVCGNCGKAFEKRPSKIAIGRGKFCSKRCAGEGRPINGKPSQVGTEAVRLFLSQTEYEGISEYRIKRWLIDLAFPAQRIAVELDGVYWHSLSAMKERDERKDSALMAAGWRVVRIRMTARDTPDRVAAAITASLAAL